MSVSKLPNNRWRAQVSHEGKNLSVPSIIGGERSYATKRAAKAARAKAREALGKSQASSVTVRGFWERWTSDPLFARPKASTMAHNRERTKGFVERYGSVPMELVGDQVVSEWLAGGARIGTVQALRAMFNDARSAKGGRIVTVNPFAELGIKKGRGNADKTPPSEETIWKLIAAAKDLAPAGFAGWLQTACFTGMRPGELDALRWDAVDFERGLIEVREQFSANSRVLTLPKTGDRRKALLTPQARAALVETPREAEFCFVNAYRGPWTASSRGYHWNAVRAAVGYKGSLYLASRHWFAWYAREVLELDAEDVAIALGHRDGGQLVRMLYGHKSADKALDRVARAFEGNVTPIRGVEGA